RVGDGLAFQLAEDRRRVAIRNRQHRDLQDRLRILDAILLPAGLAPPPRRERIAGVDRHVHDAAALRAKLGAIWAAGIDIARVVTVIAGIRVDQATDRAVLVGDLRLDSAPARTIAGYHDLALHVDAELLQLVVIGRHAVVPAEGFAR